MRNLSLSTWLLLAFVSYSSADIYFHNPRGSNNRLDGNGRNRKTDKRLFDSQNNDRGGYNVGNMYYYVGSNLGIEWTNQHSCQDQNANCNIVIQYMCDPLLRDGTKDERIPDDPNQCANKKCNEDYSFGMHEDYYYYSHCRHRKRNRGLFLADKNLNNKVTAKYTRQNNGGTRYGYECPEERDYYPYWGPTPWKDIAILTNEVSRCAYYQSESHNVKPRYACELPYKYFTENTKDPTEEKAIPITKELCEGFQVQIKGKTYTGVWREYPAHGLAPPSCTNGIWSRDNHLGNTLGGNTPNFNWTVNGKPNENCVLRIRYNISTGEYDGWSTTSKHNNRVADDPGIDMWTRFGLTPADAKSRGYHLKQNPKVDIFNTGGRTNKFVLQLAVNTNQYGRTFEDRSHKFSIRGRPSELKDALIHNLNVRGKRGNIVQVYPAVEYDFTPNMLRMGVNEYVHPQWTGSNTNPQNNDGEGDKGTDRNNMVMMRHKNYPEGNPEKALKYTTGHAGVSYPSNVSTKFGGLPEDMKIRLALNDYGGLKLDESAAYYDIGPQKITMTGDYNYMCTRNNNFSNRSQKGRLVVRESALTYSYVGELGGNVTVTGTISHTETSLYIPPGSITDPEVIQLEVQAAKKMSLSSEPPSTQYLSDFVFLNKKGSTADNKSMRMRIPLHPGTSVGVLHEASVYRSRDGSSWVQIQKDSAKSSNSAVEFQTNTGGHYVVTKKVAAGPMAGLVIGCLVGVILIVVIAIYCKTTRMPLASYSSKV